MNFYSIAQVKEAFLKLFYTAPIQIKSGATTKTVEVRYAKKLVPQEAAQVVYPVISVWDYTPEPSEKFNPSGFTYLDDIRDTDNDGIMDTGTRYFEPLLLRFRFDVGCASKNYDDQVGLEDYMLRNWEYPEPVILSFNTPEAGQVDQPVMLDLKRTKLDRPDGVHETNYEISFEAWVDIREPEDVELVTTLNLNITLKNPEF